MNKMLTDMLVDRGMSVEAAVHAEEITGEDFVRAVESSVYQLMQLANQYQVMLQQHDHMVDKGTMVFYYKIGENVGFITYNAKQV